VVRRSLETDNRLDAEVQVGGRLGPTEAVVMRMYGRLILHAESVILPLLAPDAPVVTWWHGPPPDQIATDALGVLANRRLTDSAGPGITEVAVEGQRSGGAPYDVGIARPDGRTATLSRTGEPDRQLPLARREVGDLLAEELRRMDPDYVYAEALAVATGES